MIRSQHLWSGLLVVGLVAGCITVPADQMPTKSPAGPPFSGQTLTILDHGAFAAFDALKPLFEAQTGSTLRHIEAKDAGDAFRQALLGAGNPVADVIYGVDNALFFSNETMDRQVFEPYESPNLVRINATIDVNQFRHPATRALLATPVDHGYVSVNYDVRLAQSTPVEQLPHTLRDLATAEWAPKFVTENPFTSSPGLGFLIATVYSFPEPGNYTWKDYWRDLFRNGTNPVVVEDWTTAYVYHYSGGYGQGSEGFKGDKEIVTSYTTSPAVEVLFGKDYGTTSPPGVSLEPPKGVFHQVETMAILRGTTHSALSRAFLDFCLTESFQNLTAPTMAVYPVIDGIDLPEEFDLYATSPEVLKILVARPTAIEIGLSLEYWLDEWRAIHQAHLASQD